MRWIIWGSFVLIAAAWSGVIALMHGVGEWLLAANATAAVESAAREIAAWPIPPLLALWIDPAWAQALQAWVSSGLDWAAGILPAGSSLTGWLSTLLWIVWGLGIFVLLLPTLLASWLFGQRST